MFFKDVLSAANTLLTWFAQLSVAFLFAWAVCGLIASPRTKTAIWNVFVLGATLSWIIALFSAFAAPPIQSTVPAPLATAAPALSPEHQISAYLSWSLTVAPETTFRLQRIAQILSYAYVGIVVFLLGQWVWHSYRLRLLLRGARPAPDQVSRLFEHLREQFGIRNCQLLTVSGLHSPATARWWRPRVVIPLELASQVNHSQLIDMLRHELVHVRRRDYLWDRIVTLACNVIFFHPALWLAYRQVRRQRELACDHAVAGSEPESRLRYADSLLTLARWRHTKSSPRAAVGFSAASSALGTRIHALMTPPTSSFKRTRAYSGLVITTAALSSFGILPAIGITVYRTFEHQVVQTTPAEITITNDLAPSEKKLRRERIQAAPVSPVAPSADLSIPSPQQIPTTVASLSPANLPQVVTQPALAISAQATKRSWPKMSDILATDHRATQPASDWASPHFAAEQNKHSQQKPLTGIRKALATAAIYGATYAIHETGEELTDH